MSVSAETRGANQRRSKCERVDETADSAPGFCLRWSPISPSG